MTGFSSPLQGEGRHDAQRFKGVSRIRGRAWTHLPTLTVGFLGVQIFWSVEMSYASPYLISLGISKSKMAIVFLAGPISGLLMQPLIGVLADNSTSRFGRRRPYMLFGVILCILGMLLLGYTRPFASLFTFWAHADNDILTMWLAVLSIYLIDFSINAVQAVDRALLVDSVSSSTQASGNAWAAFMLGIGNVIGFFIGNINLPRFLPFFGTSQLQALSVIVSILLLSTHLFTAMRVQERILVDTNSSSKISVISGFKEIWANMLVLPRVIRQICIIQFFAWLGWFPVLFYSTLYIGDLYKSATFAPDDDAGKVALNAEATRLGSRALFYSSVLALVAILILPLFVTEAAAMKQERIVRLSGRAEPTWNGRSQGIWRQMWTRIGSFQVPKRFQVHLASLWAVSHLVFAGSMIGTWFTSSVFGGTILLTLTGFPWAVTQWAPFSLLAQAILNDESDDDAATIILLDTRTRSRDSIDRPGEQDIFLPGDDSGSEDGQGHASDGEEEETWRKEERRRVLTQSQAQVSRLDVGPSHGEGRVGDASGGGNKSSGDGLSAGVGIILGIHNVFVVIPQFLITGISAIIFALFDPVKSVLPAHHPGASVPGAVHNATALVHVATAIPRDLHKAMALIRKGAEEAQGQSDSVVYIFRLGGIAAFIAFVLSWRLAKELNHR